MTQTQKYVRKRRVNLTTGESYAIPDDPGKKSRAVVDKPEQKQPPVKPTRTPI